MPPLSQTAQPLLGYSLPSSRNFSRPCAGRTKHSVIACLTVLQHATVRDQIYRPSKFHYVLLV
jgi:hypothetical protein